MSQLPAHSGDCQAPQAEVGGRRREPAGPEEERGGAMAAAGRGHRMAAAVGGARVNLAAVVRMLEEPAQAEWLEGRARAGNAQDPAGQPRVLVHNYLQTIRYYLQRYAMAQGMVPAGRAPQAPRYVPYPLDPQRVELDNLSSSIAMIAAKVIDPLVGELGCDTLIFRR